MAGPNALDPSTVQGVLQKLLTSQTDNRDQAKQQQQSAQQNYRDVLNETLPDSGPVSRMVSDYLQRYSANPSNSWGSLAGAVGTEDKRMSEMSMAQLARRENAAKQGLSMEDTNLKNEDAYTGKIMAATSRSRIGSGSGQTVKMDKDGNMVVYDALSGEAKTVHASQRGEYQRIWTSAYQKAVSNDMEDPESYAHGVATKVLTMSPGFNPQLQPIPSTSSTPTDQLPPIQTGLPPPQAPGQPQAQMGQPQPQPQPQAPGQPPQPGGLKQGQQEWAGNGPQRNIDLIKQEMGRPDNQDPDKQMIYQQELEKEQQLLRGIPNAPQVGKLKPVPRLPSLPAWPGEETAPETMQYKDPRTREQQKGYGGKEGEGLFKERQSLTELHGANTKLIGQLDMLERIYSDPNIPEGELANIQQQIRSGLVTLGVARAKEVGVTDLAKALGTSLSLTQKNADGHNLLPGAMSNYEDQLLQKMAPTLSLTNEGRVMLVQFMKQVAQSNLRIAQEGSKMASSNKDMLPAGWYQRKERVMREEMAKLKLMSAKMMGAR